MRVVRQPAVAGHFYPARAPELRDLVDALLAQARDVVPRSAPAPKALIVPHAGYVYSGRTAACGYALLEPVAAAIRRVVLIGPSHHVAFAGLALPEADAFATPLGEVAVDVAAQELLKGLPTLVHSAHVHAPEHSLEVQLPFLQRVLGDVPVLPLAVGDATPQQVADVLEACWGGPGTVVVVSSDLSHYLPYATAQAKDADTLRRILALEGSTSDRSACGARGINGLMLSARAHGLRTTLVDHRNSGDTAGDRARVVGYASVAFTPPSEPDGKEPPP